MRDEALQSKHGRESYADVMPDGLDALPPELDQEALAKKFAPQFEAARSVQAQRGSTGLAIARPMASATAR